MPVSLRSNQGETSTAENVASRPKAKQIKTELQNSLNIFSLSTNISTEKYLTKMSPTDPLQNPGVYATASSRWIITFH